MHHLRNSVTRTVATAVAVAAVALPVGWALAPASAQPATVAAASPTTSAPPSREDRRADRQERLAAQLGITTDQLKEARLAVLQDLLDERVAAGRMTTERAERIMDAARSGTLQELRRERRAERASRR